MRLLYGTGNPAKLDVMRRRLEGMHLEILGLKDMDREAPPVPEEGRTPLENARQKALAYYRFYGMPVFSCDSGLYFDGVPQEVQPGVHVRTVGGRYLSDEEMVAYYGRLASTYGDLTARYHNAICLVLDEDHIIEAMDESLESLPFLLTAKPHSWIRKEGFPLDSMSVQIRTGKYYYDCGEDALDEIALEDGFLDFFRRLELLDVVDEEGEPTGETMERTLVHSRGIRHRTAHVWLLRRKVAGERGMGQTDSGESTCARGFTDRPSGQDDPEAPGSAGVEILLQKRSPTKDSFPGCYDISSAGHIPAGVDYIPSALRELQEELGVEALAGDLHYCGKRFIYYEENFYGCPFVDNQVSQVYYMWLDREPEAFALQAQEVEEVRWFDFRECMQLVEENRIPHCIMMEELRMIEAALSVI